MSVSDANAGSLPRVVQTLRDLFGALCPIRIDHDMPDLDVSLWRYSPKHCEIALKPYGDSAFKERYCRVRIWIRVDGGRSYPLDHEQWMSAAQPPECSDLPADKIPDELLQSGNPPPGSSEIRDIPWMAVVSRNKMIVSGIGVFHGRVAYSDAPVAIDSQLCFFWTHCRRALPATLAWLTVLMVVCLTPVVLLVSAPFRGAVAEHLHGVWEVWSEFEQSVVSPVATPTPPEWTHRIQNALGTGLLAP